jgi:FRG domain-containing protein
VKYPHHFEVDSVQEAVALAEKLEALGAYNIFRGQTTDWPMRSSLTRLSPAERSMAGEEFSEFAAFVARTPELAEMRGDVYAITAVAQHYGMPTVLVDFSTEPAVAGCFASHGTAAKDRPSVIYFADEDFLREHYPERLPLLHTLRISVENLWRLQAQSGLFLQLPYDNSPDLDAFLAEGFGSIRFPFRGPAPEIPESAIYPNRKSRLEILFDGYTTEKRLRKGHEKLKSMGLRFAPPAPEEERRAAPAFRDEYAPAVHESWSETQISAWSRPPPEIFRRQDNPPEISLEASKELLQGEGPSRVPDQFSSVIREFLAAHENARHNFLNFQLRLMGSAFPMEKSAHPDSRLRRTAGQDLADCWDGMRLFPYPDNVICDALAYLATAWLRVHGCRQSISQTVEALLGKNVLVEFGLTIGGQNALAPVSEPELAGAFRGDLSDLLKPESQELLTQPDRILHQVYEPSRLFDFNRFVTLFGHRCVPGQFLIRLRDVILFSPTAIQRLGNR